MSKTKNAVTLSLGAAFAIAALSAPVAARAASLSSQSLSQGYQLAANDAMPASGAAGKMADGQCGAKMKDGKCGAAAKTTESKHKDGKCGEGKCGANKKKMMKDGKCGTEHMKAKDGKCGADKK